MEIVQAESRQERLPTLRNREVQRQPLIVKLTERALLIADPGETQIQEDLIDFHTLFTQSRIWHNHNLYKIKDI